MTISTGGPAAATAATDRPWRLSFCGILRSEICKLRALRSVAFAAPGAVLSLILGAAILVKISDGTSLNLRDPHGPLNGISSAGQFPTSVLVAIISVVIVCSEFSSGAINSSLLAVPRRAELFRVKAVVVLGIAITISAAGTGLGLVACFSVASPHDVLGLLGHRAYLLNSLGAIASTATFAALALVAAQWLRTAGLALIALFVGLLGPILAAPIVDALGTGVIGRFFSFTPGPLMSSAQTIADPSKSLSDGTLHPSVAIALLCCWAFAAIVATHQVLKRRAR